MSILRQQTRKEMKIRRKISDESGTQNIIIMNLFFNEDRGFGVLGVCVTLSVSVSA